MAEESKGSGGVGVFTILQIIFALCYYADPCQKDAHNKCATTIPTWNIWLVWLPTIIPVGCLLIYTIIMLCVNSTKKSDLLIPTKTQFYTIEPLTSCKSDIV